MNVPFMPLRSWDVCIVKTSLTGENREEKFILKRVATTVSVLVVPWLLSAVLAAASEGSANEPPAIGQFPDDQGRRLLEDAIQASGGAVWPAATAGLTCGRDRSSTGSCLKCLLAVCR